MRRRHQITCSCEAYSFPHRFGGGKCNMIAIVQQRAGGAMCSTCHLNNAGCEVLKGQESALECEYVIELLIFNEVKI